MYLDSCMLHHFHVFWRWIIVTLKRPLKVIQTGTIRNLECGSYSPSTVTMAVSLTIVSMALSCSSSEIKPDMSQIWFFHTPLAFGVPVRGSPSQYCHPAWCGITRMVGLPDGEKILWICITVYTQYRRVTDVGRTDRETEILPRHSPCYA